MEKNKGLRNMAEVARQRSNIYGLLAMIYREEVTADLLRQLKDAQFKGAFSELGVHLEDKFLDLPDKKLVEDLAVEYARLFLGPGKHISPHESVHLREEQGGGSLWGEPTARVKGFIESSGVEYKSDYRGIPDHIAVELEFMQEVTEREARAWEDKDCDGALHCLTIEKRFIEEHLGRWVLIFCDKLIKDAELSFYREMAKLTKSFIESEEAYYCAQYTTLPISAEAID
ncbi:MAG: molecular chaperone TorD family protein [Pseudomonadota bacterium]